jgi:hypothetical protein
VLAEAEGSFLERKAEPFTVDADPERAEEIASELTKTSEHNPVCGVEREQVIADSYSTRLQDHTSNS